MRTNRNNTEVLRLMRKSIRDDLMHIRNRVDKLARGEVPFVDIKTADAARVMHTLRQVSEEIERAILPSDT